MLFNKKKPYLFFYLPYYYSNISLFLNISCKSIMIIEYYIKFIFLKFILFRTEKN